MPTQDSTSSFDFDTEYATASTTDDSLVMCAFCDPYSPARRTYNGTVYYANYPLAAPGQLPLAPTFTGSSSTPSLTGLLYIYNNELVLGVNISSGANIANNCSQINSACVVTYGVTAFPFGSVPLASATWTQSTGQWSNLTDQRPSGF
jgi:hypothetical protein